MVGSTVIPCYRYRDAAKMIGWLCDVVGFRRHATHLDEEGGVAHAQLVRGDGMIMLGSSRDDAFGDFTSSAYVVVADPDAVHTRAVVAGAARRFSPPHQRLCAAKRTAWRTRRGVSRSRGRDVGRGLLRSMARGVMTSRRF